MREVKAIRTPNPGGFFFPGDASRTTYLEEVTKNGQEAPVPWIRVHRDGGGCTDYNVALLESIEYGPDR